MKEKRKKPAAPTPEFTPVRVKDAGGENHLFHFHARDFGEGIAVDAYDVAAAGPDGYRFQVIGPPGSDPLALVGQLIQKIRRALAVQHLRQGEFGPQIVDHVLRGRIEWDEEEDGRVPLVIVDGQPISWDRLGMLLMTYEGWQFKLEMRDPSEEL